MTMSNAGRIGFSFWVTMRRLLPDEEIGWAFPPIVFDEFADKYFVSPRVLIVGQNPSDDSPTNGPFHKDTKSGKTVRDWFSSATCVLEFRNLYNYKHKDVCKPLKSEIKMPDDIKYFADKGYKIVACGNVAQEILRKNNIIHFAIPHPSGLCRFWNDKVAAEAKIQEMLLWIQNK